MQKIDFAQVVTAQAKAVQALDAERQRIKARRNRALGSGISLYGVSIQTDDVSQQRITSAALAASLDPETTFNWKDAHGAFITLSADQIICIARAVRAHVQDCFDHEAELLRALEAGTALDCDQGWPGIPALNDISS